MAAPFPGEQRQEHLHSRIRRAIEKYFKRWLEPAWDPQTIQLRKHEENKRLCIPVVALQELFLDACNPPGTVDQWTITRKRSEVLLLLVLRRFYLELHNSDLRVQDRHQLPMALI